MFIYVTHQKIFEQYVASML